MAKRKNDTQLSSGTAVTDYGSLGIDISGGYVRSSHNTKLTGAQKIKTYSDMRDNSPVIGAVALAIKMILSKVSWSVSPSDPNNNDDIEAAEFVDQCFNDIYQNFKLFVEQALSMLWYGYSVHEILYYRAADGRLKWHSFAFRPQNTINRWIYPGLQYDNITDIEQITLDGQRATVPLAKCVHLIAADDNGSPEGKSVLRNAYRPWYFVTNLENHEAIRIERDAVGIPVARIPIDCLANDAPEEKRAIKNQFTTIVANLKNDEQAGLVLPSTRDDKGNLLYDIQILGAGGAGGAATRTDTNTPIQRYNTQILMSLLADFMMLGHAAVGSFALSSDKTNLFGQALAGILCIIDDGLDQQAIKPLLALNGFTGSCEITHSDVEKLDLSMLTTAIEGLTRAGMILNDKQTEDHMRALLDLPEREDDEDFTALLAAGQDDDKLPDETMVPNEDAESAEANDATQDNADPQNNENT